MDGVCAVKAFCNPSFSTNADDVKSVHVVLTDNGKPCFGHCTCTVGLRKDCAHVGALLYVLCEIVAEGLTELPADPACTDIPCPWVEPKGSHCDPKFAEDINIYKAKFGKEPPKKKFKPSPSVAERKYSFTFEEDKDFERKIKLKNDLLITNERSSLPPVFHLITGKLPNELESVQQSSQEPSHEMQDIDLAHALEVEVETSTKIELPVHTQASAVNNLGQCSKAHKSSAIDSIISPPKQQPVSLTEIKDRAERIKKKLFITKEEVESVERGTREQSNCQLWFDHRAPRITASKCKRALVQKGTSPKKALSDILQYKNQVSTELMKDGIESEPAIIEKYSKETNVEVHKSGLFISKTHPFLAASPDGLIGDDKLVEVKKVHPKDNEGLLESLVRRRICKKNGKGQLILNPTHSYYYQVQQQLFCSGRKVEDFVASDGDSMYIDTVKYDEAFWEKNLPRLQGFFYDCMLLEMAYPRVKYGLDRLGKLGITYTSLSQI